MKLRGLRTRNFLSFGDQVQEIQFDGSDVSFVVGPNNAGKSNIFRALSFIADCIAVDYPNPTASVTPYRHQNRRDFEVAVEIELNESELQALRDFLVCANMTYNFGGDSQESRRLGRLKDEILSKHGDKLFGELTGKIVIVVKGSDRERSEFRHFVHLAWGKEDFLLQRDNCIGKLEVPETSGFSYHIFSTLIVEDFKQRYPAEFNEVGGRGEVIDSTYVPPDMPGLLNSRLASETVSRETAFAGIQIGQLNFGEFEQRFGITETLQRLWDFLRVRGLWTDRISFSDLITRIYASSIVWVGDLRGSPPDYQRVSWERPVEHQGIQYWGGEPKSRIQIIRADDLPTRLFGFLTSSDATYQRRYDEIQAEFGKFTDGLRFRVYLEEREAVVTPEINLVSIPQPQIGIQSVAPITDSAIVGVRSSEERKMVKVVGMQMLDSSSSWPVRLASAGTVEVLALLTGIIGAKDQVLLLDEPAQNMHPAFQTKFLDLLKRHVKEDTNQAVVITHSPFLLTRDCLADSWRVSREKDGETIISPVAQLLAKPNAKLLSRISQQLDSGDVRSLLFSRGAVFVEGLSDKWVLQEIDRKASLAGHGINLVEKDWVVVAMNTSGNTDTFLNLAELLGLDYAFLLDSDAKSIVEGVLEKKGLQQVDEQAMRDNGFYVLRTNLDDLFGIGKENKPLKALNRVLEIKFEDVPPEFREFLDFVEQRVQNAKAHVRTG